MISFLTKTAEKFSFQYPLNFLIFAVNSVGTGRENLERYGDNPSEDSQILKVNGLGAAEFLSCVLPAMEKTGGGQIVVLSSSQGVRPIPMLAAYCATKVRESKNSEPILLLDLKTKLQIDRVLETAI